MYPFVYVPTCAFLCVRVHVCIPLCTCLCVYLCVRTYVCIPLCTCLCVYSFVYVSTCAFLCVRVVYIPLCTCLCVYTSVYVSMCVFLCIRVYVYSFVYVSMCVFLCVRSYVCIPLCTCITRVPRTPASQHSPLSSTAFSLSSQHRTGPVFPLRCKGQFPSC